MSTISLKNQRIVIIGGSSGIGLATAKQAVEQGAAVIIAGRSQDKLEKAQHLLGFDSVEIHSLDNQNEQDLKDFFEKSAFLTICSLREPPMLEDRLLLAWRLHTVALMQSSGRNIML